MDAYVFLEIAIGIAVLVYIGYLVANRKWEELRSDAYVLILQAERAWGKRDGNKKFKFVLDTLYAKLPWILILFVDEDVLSDSIQYWYDELKDYLDNGKLDDSVPNAPVKK